MHPVRRVVVCIYPAVADTKGLPQDRQGSSECLLTLQNLIVLVDEARGASLAPRRLHRKPFNDNMTQSENTPRARHTCGNKTVRRRTHSSVLLAPCCTTIYSPTCQALTRDSASVGMSSRHNDAGFTMAPSLLHSTTSSGTCHRDTISMRA
jgi:hypothetical protein